MQPSRAAIDRRRWDHELARASNAHSRTNAFTIVEVMMASVILVVGFIGMIEALTVTSGRMDHARRQTLAAQILNHQIEDLRSSSWTTISSLAAGPTNISPIDSQFTSAIAASGATYSISRSVTTIDTNLREITFTVTWVVTTSRRDSGGSPLTFTYTRVGSAYYGKYGLNLTYQRS